MSKLDDTDYARVSATVAEQFVEAYYTALNDSRPQIASFYLPSATNAGGRALPHISYNGEVINDATILQKTFEDQMPFTHYEPQSIDSQVMNPAVHALEGKSKKEQEKNMSIVIQVSGYVRTHERKEGPLRGFSDSFVLVSNYKENGGRLTGKSDSGRQWVIQTQNFRFVV